MKPEKISVRIDTISWDSYCFKFETYLREDIRRKLNEWFNQTNSSMIAFSYGNNYWYFNIRNIVAVKTNLD